MKAADTSAGRKPWRYYYVMAFPLGGIAQDKLMEMTEMTTVIEQREEEYLRKVAARNAAHAAAVEAEQRAAKDKHKPTMASHVAWVLRRLCAVSVFLLLVAVAVGYTLYVKDDGRERVPQRVIHAATIAVIIVLVVNLGGWFAAHKCSINGARVLLVLSLALVIGLALLLDEVVIVRRSHTKLREAMAQSQDALLQDTIALILNGGTVPSLVQRFVFDAPSIFLQWLDAHCSGPKTTKLGYTAVAIDRREFFTPFWSGSEKSCVDTTLRGCVEFDEIVQLILIGELVMVSLQLLFTGVFLVVADSVKTFKRRRQFFMPKAKALSLASKLSIMLTRLLLFGAALCGSSNAIASTDLLNFCSIADFHTLFTWVITVCLLSGISTLLAALFISCGWKEQMAGVLLVVAVASEVFMLAELIKMAARVIEPAENAQVQTQELRGIYMKASEQTCSSVEHWISHICVGMLSIENSAEFNLSCQQEFVALLTASFNFMKSYLTWSIGVKLILLVQLILPALRQAVVDVVSCVCCLSSRGDLTVKTVETVETMIQQAPLDYEKAVEIYLSTMRVKDSKAEGAAFEKEWSARTKRILANVRTPRVDVSASDFGAIVRTLMLRRLTAICKLDVSLSVSEDGELLLVRIFASDNLLLATLCETETYRLQFADAIDPGRSFWRDKREVYADQKVLDANTVKHRLKLLLAEKAMSPKEAVWFPSESLARVSDRVHALSRTSRASRGLIHCSIPAPAFASYSPNIQRQFIYKKYPNKLDIPETYRRSAVLRIVDCIRITRCIINAEIDMNAAVASGLVSSFHCLHSSSRFDLNSRGALASSWVTFWRPIHLPGEFYPKNHAILNLIGRISPFRQPLQDVRDYFGELIGFYFAWLEFYGKMMVLPAVIAIVALASDEQHSLPKRLWIFYTSKVSEKVDKIDATISKSEVILGLAVIAWSFALAKLWERRSVWYQLQWGVTTSDADSVHHYNSNHVIEYKQSLCSGLASVQRQLKSWLCVLALGSGNIVVVLSILLSQVLLVDVCGEKFAVLGSCMCQALLVQWNGAYIPFVAHALSKWENPHCSSDHPTYQHSVVAKLFTLQLFNTFTGLMLLMLCSVGGLAPLVHLVVPLTPLFVAYNARIEGHVGIFIQMETLIIAIFAVQLCIRVFLILSAVKRFRMIQRRELRYSRKVHEDETMLPPYPGPDKDYAQVVMQFGLVIMFSGVCPVLPLLALIDCAVKMRQNALELCCIRRRPEPEGVQSFGSDDDNAGLGLWTPCMLIMIKLSVPVALALAFFTADNFKDISVERRVGYWLFGVLGIWLLVQLLWFLIPRESRLAEEARARNAFLVERYFGRAEVHDQKTSSKDTNVKSVEKEDLNLQEPAPSIEQTLRHYEERLELLHRLNALPKRKDVVGPVSLAATKSGVSAVSGQNVVQGSKASEEVTVVSTQGAEKLSVEDETRHRESESSEEMVVGYFRPVREMWPSPAKREEASPVVESTVLPRTLPVEEMKISQSSEKDNTPIRAESGGDTAPTGPPAPILMSKLFKRIPPHPSTVPSSASDKADSSMSSPLTAPFMSTASSLPQVDIEPGVFAPTEAVAMHDDELLEEKQAALRPATKEPTSSVANVNVGVDLKSSASVHSEVDSQAEAAERKLFRQLSPRLSFFSRKSQRVSESEESSVMPESPAPRRLSMLFKRPQPPSSAQPAPPPSVVTNISAFAKTEAEDRTVNPIASLRDQFDFLSDAHAESTAVARRRSTSPPPKYTKIDLSGLEAVREAASRCRFDFSADEQGTTYCAFD